MADEATTQETTQLDPELEKIFEQLDGLSLGKAAELVKALEERWGVSAAAPVAAMPAAGGEGAAQEEEKTSFDVVLEGVGDQKIKVIKAVREVTSLGLKDAKGLVEAAPKAIKEGVTKEEAEELKAKFEEVGATIKID